MNTIEFACPRCDQGFRVSSKQCGRRLRCPACGMAIGVPSPEVAAVQWAERAATRHRQVWPEFAIDPDHPVDDLPTWELPAEKPVRRRWAVWLCLLVALAAVAYRAGIRWGLRHVAPSPASQRQHLHRIAGQVKGLGAATGSRREGPAGVLLVAIPSNRRLDQRIPAMVMLPEARETQEYRDAVRSIQFIGGDVAISDAAGNFVWHLATRDVYDLFAISEAPSFAEMPTSDLAAVGHLFVPAYDLLAGRRYKTRQRLRMMPGDQLTIDFAGD